MSEDFFRKLSKKEIDALTNVDFASQGKSENSSHKLLHFFYLLILSSFYVN